jgi:hypothetical protein
MSTMGGRDSGSEIKMHLCLFLCHVSSFCVSPTKYHRQKIHLSWKQALMFADGLNSHDMIVWPVPAREGLGFCPLLRGVPTD